MARRPFLFWGFKPAADVVSTALGGLERKVLEIVWSQEPVSVRDVHGALPGPVAYTTVMTTLDRLFKKGILERRRAGRAYLYSASAPRHEVESRMALGVVEGMLGAGSEAARPLLSQLVDTVATRDPALLDSLERLVREKQRQRRGEEDP